MSGDLIDTTEMYLRTIFELEEEGVTPLRARIAERLGQSGPTVSQTVARMERDELVVVTADRSLEMTASGRRLAVRVMRKHRLAERLLLDVIGLDWELGHAEACRWEHVMSEQVERKIFALLGEPTTSPYGNPIPGLDELTSVTPANESKEPKLDNVVNVTEKSDTAVDVTLCRIGEPLQANVPLMADFAAVGLVPGARISAQKQGSTYEVKGTEIGPLQLGVGVSSQLFVTVP